MVSESVSNHTEICISVPTSSKETTGGAGSPGLIDAVYWGEEECSPGPNVHIMHTSAVSVDLIGF